MNQTVTGQPFVRQMNLRLVLSVIAAGILSFTGVVVETSMNVAFPTLMKEFDIGTSTVQWITTGYLLVIAIIIPTSAFLKKRFRIKQLFVIAVAFFLLGTILDAVAPSFSILLLGRLIQGVGTGIALPLMYNIVLDQVPFENMGFMMGVANTVTGVAPAIGPSFGGLVVNSLGWRYVFIFLIPVLIVSLVMGILTIRQATELEKVSLDVKGLIFLAICFVTFLLGINRAGTDGFTDKTVLLLFAVAVVCFILFLLAERKNENPLLNLKVFSYSRYTLSAIGIFIIFFLCLGFSYLIPNYAQLVLDANALQAGLILVPGAVLAAILSPFAGRLYDKVGAAKPILLGCLSIVIACVIFTLSHNLTIAFMAGFYLFFTFGQAMFIGNTMTNGLSALPEQMSADGNAVNNTVQQLSSAVGTSVVTTVVAMSQLKAGDDLALGTQNGAHAAFLVLLVIAIVMFLVSVKSTLGKK